MASKGRLGGTSDSPSGWTPSLTALLIERHSLKETGVMEQKTARLTVLVDPTKKAAFEELCANQDVTPSQVVRQMIREYLEKHGVSYANQPQRPTDGT